MKTERTSFWDTYPDAVVIETFRKLKEAKGDGKSSDLMWYIHCVMDPENVFLQHLDEKKRIREIAKYYEIVPADVKLPMFKAAVEWYKVNWISPTRRMLNALRLKLFEAQQFIEDKKIKEADDILYFADMQKAYKDFKVSHDEAETLFKAEGPTKKKLGGSPLGAADNGDIFDLL